MNYSEDDLISVSALAHYSYCERRCALVHIEQVWNENVFTVEGRILHEKVHEEGSESRGAVRIARGVPLRSLRLGLVGVSDVVEFRSREKQSDQPFPVEYKRGKPKLNHCDAVQLCAQALCLEEMLSVSVPEGALFYGSTRRRSAVLFDENLRNETEETARRTRVLIRAGVTPLPKYAKRCTSCSLIDECLPKKMENGRSVKRYIRRLTEDV